MPFDGVWELDIGMLDHQFDLVADIVSDIIALEGGLGCGKTVAGILKMLERVDAEPGIAGLWIEPTRDLIGSIFLATLDELFPEWGIPFEFRTQWRGRRDVLLIYPGEPRQTPVYLRSGDAPQRIVGFKVGWFIVDEADQQDREVWRRAGQRLRDKRAKKRQQIAVFTPELGFNWTYTVFHEEKEPPGLKRRVIEGIATTSNVFNPDDYVPRLTMGLDEDERSRVLTGKRIQRNGLVYKRFGVVNEKECKNPLAGTVFIGADFNWTKMCWVFGRHLGGEIHFWGELVREHTDTIAQCDAALEFLEREYSKYGQRMSKRELAEATELVPDASVNQHRTSSMGTASDLDHLIRAGFDVRRPSKNPPVADRVFSMNAGFHDKRIFVDPVRCPFLVKCLKQQAWNEEKQEPDKKKGLDHAPDAAGYPVHFYEPSHVRRGNQPRKAA